LVVSPIATLSIVVPADIRVLRLQLILIHGVSSVDVMNPSENLISLAADRCQEACLEDL
jgi:hypothetical protein